MAEDFTIQCTACKAEIAPIQPGEASLACPACGKVMAAYEAGMQEVRAYIRQSALVNAIGRYRRLTGADLKTAKDTVSEMWHNGDW